MRVIGEHWDQLKKFYHNSDQHDTFLAYGSAASGKSKSIARFLSLLLATQAGVKAFVMRKVSPVLKDSVISDIKEALADIGFKYNDYVENKTERTILLKNGSIFLFRSLDDPEKIKSIDVNYIWLEEATEFSLNEYSQTKLRARKKNKYGKNCVFLSYNPVGRANWTYSTFFEKIQNDTYIFHSTYKINPFLGKREINNIEKMRDLNPAYWTVYGEGQYGLLEGQIYDHIEFCKPKFHSPFDEIIYGLDFGFNNPTALVKIGVYDQNYYIIDEIYRPGMTTADLIKEMERIGVDKKNRIFADSAEPDRIEELRRAGYNMFPAWKGKNSVVDGINKLKMQKISIYNTCTETMKEANSYRWLMNKDNKPLDVPEKLNDHAMDAMRYAITSHLENGTGDIYIGLAEEHAPNRFRGFPR